ncbi:hypothetical protein Tco_1217793 [Tanacetum coccineum]
MASSITRFDIEKFDGKNDFGLWKIKMRDLMVQQGYDAALEQLPADMEAREKGSFDKKAYRYLDSIFGFLVFRVLTDMCILHLSESLIMEDVLATLNSRELKKRTEGIKEESGDGLYVRGMSDHSGKAHSGGSSWFKSRDGTGKLKCFICHSEDHLKRYCLKKKSNRFVKKCKRDQDSDSFHDEGNVYFGEAVVVVGNDEMTELVMNSSGSYHMTHRRDFLYDYKVVDGGLIQLEDVKYVPRLRRSLISLGTLEKEGYTMKMQMCRIKVDKRVWFKVELQGAQRNREAEVFQVSNDDVAMAQRRLEDKQLEEKTNTDCLVKEQENVHLGIKVGANITVTRVLGQEGAEGNVAE